VGRALGRAQLASVRTELQIFEEQARASGEQHERQKGECTAMRANLKEAARTLEAVRWQTSNVQDLTGSDQ
jgi:hypothetical protein